jgi:hypothetical protein
LIAEASYVAYYALLDRGNVVAAGNRLDVASQAALQAMRGGKQTGEDFARIFAEMAYFSAFHRGDAERGNHWFDLCAEFWLEPSQRHRAEAAVLFGEGNVVAARALAERSNRDLTDGPVFGDSLAEANRAAEIVRACDGEPHRPESILTRGRSATIPPLVINAHGARFFYRLLPWLCLSTSLLLVAFAGAEVGASEDESGVVWIALASPVVLLLSVFGFVLYMLIAHSWIEVTAEGVGYVLSRKMHWLEWSRFRGSGKIARMPFGASGLILWERVTLQKARGPLKQISGIPFSSFAPNWREGQIGGAIRDYAPHLLATETKPTGWLM